jgi:hypothetical protein
MRKLFDVAAVHNVVDGYLVGKLGLHKVEGGYYFGDGGKGGFAKFGLAFNALHKREWFVNNVGTWLYFNNDASDSADDFVVEDFKAYCRSFPYCNKNILPHSRNLHH